MNPPGRYIAIEGPIGVGKTSLARTLARDLSARLILEEIDGNPFLQLFYDDADRYALPAQLHFLLARYQQQREFAGRRTEQAAVADYLFVKDRIFAGLNLAPAELALYQTIVSLIDTRLVAQPDLVVFMNARVEVLAERLRKRNRDFERHISLEYLDRVASAFRDFFFEYDATPLLVIETSAIDFVEDSDDLRDLTREIERVRTGVQHFVPRKR